MAILASAICPSQHFTKSLAHPAYHVVPTRILAFGCPAVAAGGPCQMFHHPVQPFLATCHTLAALAAALP
eukprot:2436015-Prorocentrum_lima.AAC.1